MLASRPAVGYGWLMKLVPAIAAACIRNPIPGCDARANRNNNNTQPTLRVGD